MSPDSDFEDGLEFDEKPSRRELVRQPERVHLAPGPGERREAAHGVPLRLAEVLRGDAHAVGERPQRLGELVEEVLGSALDEEAARPAVHRSPHPVPAERRGHRALGFDPVGPHENGTRLPPAIKPANGLAVQNAFGFLHRSDCSPRMANR